MNAEGLSSKKIQVKSWWKRFFLWIILLIIISLVFTFFLEWRFFDNSYIATLEFVKKYTKVFAWNAILMFFIILFFSSIFRKPFSGIGTTFALLIAFCFINTSKILFRGQPVLPEDFMLADQTGTLTKFISIPLLIRTIIAIILVILVTLLLNHLFKNWLETESKKFWWKKNYGVRIALIVFSTFGFISASSFAINHNGERNEELPFLDTKFIAWNQVANYEQVGAILGFMYNTGSGKIDKPDGYSEEKMAEIKSNATDNSDDKQAMSSSGYNIVIILDESFYDPSIISKYYPVSKNENLKYNSMNIPVTDEIIPTIKTLAKNYPTGQMYSIDYGGGTANMEFEVDTSMSNYWLNTVPYVNLIPKVKSVPSIASVAKENGYDTVAIHPFSGGMYKRNIALPREGFDDFITENEMDFTEKDDNRQYINDRSAYNQALEVLNEHQEKTLVSLITMQNHAGYGTDGYRTRSYHLNGDFSDEEKNEVEIYLESLHNSDYYLGEFLNALSKSDEKTVVLFYGDHSPGIFSRIDSSEDSNIHNLSRLTPYFIWSNFSNFKEAVTKESYQIKSFNIANSTLPTTTPNCLTNTMFNLLNLEKPAYMNLVDPICQEYPILAQSYFCNDSPFQSTELSNYELYIYDTLVGKQYFINN